MLSLKCPSERLNKDFLAQQIIAIATFGERKKDGPGKLDMQLFECFFFLIKLYKKHEMHLHDVIFCTVFASAVRYVINKMITFL